MGAGRRQVHCTHCAANFVWEGSAEEHVTSCEQRVSRSKPLAHGQGLLKGQLSCPSLARRRSPSFSTGPIWARRRHGRGSAATARGLQEQIQESHYRGSARGAEKEPAQEEKHGVWRKVMMLSFDNAERLASL